MLNEAIRRWIAVADDAAGALFREKDPAIAPLEEAMEYSITAGGKRLRPVLVILVCEACGGCGQDALPFGLACEMLHTYSLIHDDLPCMDDDDLRRGKPTNHRVFGEAQAVLAGDALQTEAFCVLARTPHPHLTPHRRCRVIAEFCDAVGRQGMVGGQMMDLVQTGQATDLDRLRLLHRKKTGALIRFCVRLGGHLAGATAHTMRALTQYGEAIGLLFQVVDDLLDVESTSQKLGKTAGKDALQDKATFPKIIGLQATRADADALLEEALAALTKAPIKGTLLADLARFFRAREH